MKQRIISIIVRHYMKIIKLLITIGVSIILIQCIKFGKGKDGWYFHWMPAAKIEVKK